MLSSLSLPVLILIFVGAAAFVWIAGIKLSDTTDVLSERLGLGEALGGLIILSIVTNLPEIAITSSAALRGNLGVATGNILGGIAIQTVVLVVLDVFGVRGGHPLTYRAASLVLVLEGVLLMAILTVTVMGTQLPPSLIFWRVSPASLLIVGLWVVGLWLIGRARSDLPWREKGDAPGGQEEPQGVAKTKKGQDAQNRETSITRTAIVFAISALVTLVGGVVLEVSGDDIAGQLGMSGVLFGSTFLAAATALPEVSTGLGSVRLRDYKLAVSDIFGGNAFLPVLFLLASLLSGVAPLPQAQKTDIYLTGLGALLTTVYLYGLIFRSRLRFLHMGIDSLVALVLYGLGIAGLVAVAHG
ncbi:MAG: sodium:calcium antiporter [Actinomycetota bacterium]|nr:sodium:calcium antiporter [Actinomycetota bacterium]